MKRSTLLNRSAILAALGAGLALAGCNQAPTAQQAPPPQAALPLTTAAAPPIVDAPSANELPPAPRARTARVADPRDRYAYADQAYAMSYGLGDAPPDYSFDYDGDRPWVWRSDDNSERVVEPLADGDRYYYYQPGQDTPYLVRDTDYTYGYDNGVLVVVYDRNGRLMPPDFVDRRADYAGRYLARGHDLYDASQHRQREAVAAANWSLRRTGIAAALTIWASQQNQDPDWRAYHTDHDAQQRAYWDQERYRRQAEAARADEMLNDHQSAQIAWQAAQQAQADARARGQNVGGGQRGGIIPPIFGQRNNSPSAQPQIPPQGQAQYQAPGAPVGPTPGRPAYGPAAVPPTAQAQSQFEAQRQAATAQKAAGDQARLQADNQGRLQADAQARQQTQAAAKAESDAAHKAAGNQARLQADNQARLQADAQARQQAQAAQKAAGDQARLQADRQARLQADAQARQQAQAAQKAAGDQARLQADRQARLQADAQVRQQAQAAAKTQAVTVHKAVAAPAPPQQAPAAAKAQAATAHAQAGAAADKAKADAARRQAQKEHDAHPGNPAN